MVMNVTYGEVESGVAEATRSMSSTLSGDENDRVKRSNLEWLVEHLDPQIMRFLKINSILDQCSTQYQNIVIVDTKSFGKVYVVNGKLDSAEADEFIYSECLVHPALLLHHNPKEVFIMGGSDGSTAREVLKHRSVKRVVMCDIDQEAVEFYKLHATENKATFADQRLHIVYNDIKAELEGNEMFDVIIGDLADPIKGGGPYNRFYTKSFYEDVIKPKLHKNGIFVTQAGPAGVLSHKDIFSPIYNTIRQVFKQVIVITAPVPSYADSWGWVIATDRANEVKFERMTKKMLKRMSRGVHYLTPSFLTFSAHLLNQTVSIRLLKENRVITDENLMFANEDGIVEDDAPESGAAMDDGGHAP